VCLLRIDHHNDGDAADDGIPNNHAGRSWFANHAFAMLVNDIFDPSLCKVDVDSYPDECWCTDRELDGDDTWTNDYRDRVIDDVPSPPEGTDLEYITKIKHINECTKKYLGSCWGYYCTKFYVYDCITGAESTIWRRHPDRSPLNEEDGTTCPGH